jgi:serine/threonine-protein kinase mTOR
MRRQLYKKLYEEAYKGLRASSSPDVVHGSLLALREISIHTVKVLDGKFKEVCEIIMKFKDHRDSLVRKTVISLIPKLAELDPDQFYKENYLQISMNFFIVQLKKEKERAVGKI